MTVKKEEAKKEVTTTTGAGAGVVALPEEFAGMFDLRENMKGVLPRLPQISIIHKAEMFKFPDEIKKGAFQGIILQKQFCNAWWKEPFDVTGGGTPPDCSSLDAVTPDYNSPEIQAEKCAKCLKNQFKSDGGAGKACKNMVRLHLQLANEPTPHRLSLSPANLRPVNDYISRVSLKGYPFQLVYTDFRLIPQKNKSGIEYSEIVMDMKGVVTDKETAALIKQQHDQWMPAFLGQLIGADEV